MLAIANTHSLLPSFSFVKGHPANGLVWNLQCLSR